jgi:glycosyl transferase family 87
MATLRKIAEPAQTRRMVALLALTALAYCIALAIRLQTRWYDLDFSAYYYWAYALRTGSNPYSTDLQPLATRLGLMSGGITHANYPPTFILCFEPLTLARPEIAYWIWTSLNALILLVAVAVLLNGLAIDGRTFATFAALAILYEPVTENFFWSQAQIVLLLLLVLNLRWVRSGNDVAAGFSLALAGLLKIFPLLMLLHLALARRVRAVAWTIIGLAAGGAITLLLVGWTGFGFLRPDPTIWGTYWTAGLSVNASISKTFAVVLGQSLSRIANVARIAIIVLAISALIMIAARATLISARVGRADLAYGIWIVLAVFIFPITWIHHMVLLLIPLAQPLTAARHDRAMRRAVVLAAASYLTADAVMPLFWVYWLTWRTWLLAPSGVMAQLAGALAFCSAYQLAVAAPVSGTAAGEHVTNQKTAKGVAAGS